MWLLELGTSNSKHLRSVDIFNLNKISKKFTVIEIGSGAQTKKQSSYKIQFIHTN